MIREARCKCIANRSWETYYPGINLQVMENLMCNKIALVTGGSRGIGKAICIGLACDGYDILLNYRSSDDAANEVKEEILRLGRKCDLLRFDVADICSVNECLDPVIEKVTPDALVNNAGFASDGMFGLMTEKSWTSVVDATLNGFFNVTRKIVPAMIHARKGRIISISSISGQAGNSGQVNYSAAKAGLIGASKALAKEIGPRGILVNVVSPGIIETDMTHKLPLDKLKEQIPLRRPGSPEDVAGCVRFLCSDLANYITGQVIAVNGGLYA